MRATDQLVLHRARAFARGRSLAKKVLAKKVLDDLARDIDVLVEDRSPISRQLRLLAMCATKTVATRNRANQWLRVAPRAF